MITFLPLSDLRANFECLDNKRLPNQRGECLWMLNGLSRGYVHTVSKLWVGHIDSLARYGMMCSVVCRERGYKDDYWPQFYTFLTRPLDAEFVPPPWWGSKLLHSSHRGNLLRKNIGYYGVKGKGWTDPIRETYFWPHDSMYDWRTKLGDGPDTYFTGAGNPQGKPSIVGHTGC